MADKQAASDKEAELKELYCVEKATRVPRDRGFQQLKDGESSKGMAHSFEERRALGIHGLLPPVFLSQEQQAARVLKRLRELSNDLERYVFLDNLQDRNEQLFYYCLINNVRELLPLVYTPTVGEACKRYGEIYQRPRGICVTINDSSVSQIYEILSNWPHNDVRAIVVTDGERILGLGDLGAQGLPIACGKLALYVALGGVNPRWCLPVILDVGTDNEELLKSDRYLGLRQKRTRGDDYDRLVENFYKACSKRFGSNVLIQLEDFANTNAFRLADVYRDTPYAASFNDDISGTAVSQKLSELTFLFFGAGESALGIADLIVQQLQRDGRSQEDACAQIYLQDSKGIITKQREEPIKREQQKPYIKDVKPCKELLQVVKNVKPHVLIGTSTQGGAFSEEVIKAMAEITERPVIFALSNPTDNAECTAENAYKWTNGKCLYAAGSPFEDVEVDGKTYVPGQANNSFVFPGLALGIILFQLRPLRDEHLLSAARVIADFSYKNRRNESQIYPDIAQTRQISECIARQLGADGYKDGNAHLWPKPADLDIFIHSQLYDAKYASALPEQREWPAADTQFDRKFASSERDNNAAANEGRSRN